MIFFHVDHFYSVYWICEKGMATCSNILAWRIPWTVEPSRLQSMGSQRVGHNCVTITFEFVPNISSVSCFVFLALRHVGSQLPNQDWTCTLCTGGQSLNHWATREVPKCHVNSMYRWYNGRIKPFTFIVFLSKTHDP